MKVNQTRAALYVLCIARAGYVRGAQLIEFIEAWQRVVRAAGRPVTMPEFTAATNLAERTAYRRLTLFRSSFPELPPDALPSALMGPLLRQLAAKQVPDVADVDLDWRPA